MLDLDTKTGLYIIPQHLAIVMDGNGRWAKKKLLPRAVGHNYGAKNVEKIVLACKKFGIKHITLFAFSTENWHRPKEEIDNMFELLRSYLKNQLNRLIAEDIKINFVGDLEKIPPDLQSLIQEAQDASAGGEVMLTIAMSYGGREEIRAAAVGFANDARRYGKPIKGSDFDKYLSTHTLPPLDLLIRTGGEYRLSNFMLWHLAYTELYFCDTLWPDFKEKDLYKALVAFNKRERRYGR